MALPKHYERGNRKQVPHFKGLHMTSTEHDTTGLKWKWQSVKQAGVRPSPRCGFTLAPTGADKAILFGGVYDELDEEEELEGVFYNDMYQLDLMKPTWHEGLLLRMITVMLCPCRETHMMFKENLGNICTFIIFESTLASVS